MSLQLLTVIIQACSIGATSSPDWQVMKIQRSCQIKLIACFEKNRNGTKEIFEVTLAKCLQEPIK